MSQPSNSLYRHLAGPATRCMRATLDGEFTEGHELDRKTEKQVPKAMIGRRLSQEEAKRVLINLHADRCPLSPPKRRKRGTFPNRRFVPYRLRGCSSRSRGFAPFKILTTK